MMNGQNPHPQTTPPPLAARRRLAKSLMNDVASARLDAVAPAAPPAPSAAAAAAFSYLQEKCQRH